MFHIRRQVRNFGWGVTLLVIPLLCLFCWSVWYTLGRLPSMYETALPYTSQPGYTHIFRLWGHWSHILFQVWLIVLRYFLYILTMRFLHTMWCMSDWYMWPSMYTCSSLELYLGLHLFTSIYAPMHFVLRCYICVTYVCIPIYPPPTALLLHIVVCFLYFTCP